MFSYFEWWSNFTFGVPAFQGAFQDRICSSGSCIEISGQSCCKHSFIHIFHFVKSSKLLQRTVCRENKTCSCVWISKNYIGQGPNDNLGLFIAAYFINSLYWMLVGCEHWTHFHFRNQIYVYVQQILFLLLLFCLGMSKLNKSTCMYVSLTCSVALYACMYVCTLSLTCSVALYTCMYVCKFYVSFLFRHGKETRQLSMDASSLDRLIHKTLLWVLYEAISVSILEGDYILSAGLSECVSWIV